MFRALQLHYPHVMNYELSMVSVKARFLNTCDTCMHARVGGETFGLAMAACSTAGLPVITYNSAFVGENYHLHCLVNMQSGRRSPSHWAAS